MALGARQQQVLLLVVGQGMSLALIGVVIGLAASFALTRVMASLLYGVSEHDPLTFASIALLNDRRCAGGLLPPGSAGGKGRSDDCT